LKLLLFIIYNQSSNNLKEGEEDEGVVDDRNLYNCVHFDVFPGRVVARVKVDVGDLEVGKHDPCFIGTSYYLQ